MGTATATAAILVSCALLLPGTPTLQLPLLAVTTEGAGGPFNLETVPVGALAWLDGQPIGTTPLTLTSLPAGRHRLLLTMENHRDWSGDIQVPVGVALKQRVDLPPLPAQINLASPLRGSRAWIDGRERGGLPLNTELEPGEHLIRVEADGLRPTEERAVFGPNERRSMFATASGGEIALVPADPSRGIAVMIDNQDDARPQFGLNRADVVYEAFAEGGITRYLALFLTQEAEQIGPVRSARHYFVNWASEYLAPLVHIGASPQGYQALASAPIPDVDGRAFYRMPGRPAPHDAVTSTELIRTELGPRPVSTFGGLHFRYELRSGQESPAAGLRFKYGAWPYEIRWSYDSEREEYVRSINDRELPDAASGEPIAARNVVVLWMDSWLIPDDEAGRLDFQQVGSGRMVALTDGVVIEGKWSRTSIRNVTEYRDSQGKNLLLTPGSTWFQVVPPHLPVEILPAAGNSNEISN